MPAPIVSWYNTDNTTQILQWDIGTVDAGSVSEPPFGVLIWNNRLSEETVSDMTSTTITTKDGSGGNSGELVENFWIEAKVNSGPIPEGDFYGMGGTTTRVLRADDTNIDAGIIKGTANDGTKENSRGNFCDVLLRANVPPTATAGLVNFLTRVSYQYV
jgi:hypothetical protein